MMKIKIFSRAIFTLLWLIAAGSVFAQQGVGTITVTPVPVNIPLTFYIQKGSLLNGAQVDGLVEPSPQDSTYRREMRKLGDQMRELQSKMSELRSEEARKNAAARRELNKKMMTQSFKSLEGMKSYTYTYSDNTSGASHGMGVTINGSEGSFYNSDKGDDYIKKKLESGDAKEKTKSYTKSYNVDGNDKIMINNQFGKVTVNTWIKSGVKVEVQIRTVADNDDDAQKMLDAVTIADEKNESGVSFKTNIERENGGSNHYNVHKTEVNYTVYMPAKNSLAITNRFGSVRVPDLTGKVVLDLAYGNLYAQQLTNPLNEVTMKFGDANIQSLNSNTLNISYGKLNVGTADNLNAKLSFSTAVVDRLKSSGNISIRYGNGLKVGQLDKNVKNLNVDASFTKVLLNVKEDYDFDVTTKLGNFYYNDGPIIVLTKSPADDERGFSSTKTYKGKVGKGNSDKMITIKSTYSSVKFDDGTNN